MEVNIREAIYATRFDLEDHEAEIVISYLTADDNNHEVRGLAQLPADLAQQFTADASEAHFKTW